MRLTFVSKTITSNDCLTGAINLEITIFESMLFSVIFRVYRHNHAH